MRVLYVAGAIDARAASGGSTHVAEVACGLKALGHELMTITKSGGNSLPCGLPLTATNLPQQIALLGFPKVSSVAQKFKPEVVMERFYNFAGAGILYAHRNGIPSMLEVNAPMVDPPGSTKTRLDWLLLGSMRRWAVRQAMWSAAIVTPLSSTVPPEILRGKIHELPWGANVKRFDPALRQHDPARREQLAREIGLTLDFPVAVFLGSFRAWHGVAHFADAARRLLLKGSNLSFIAIGGGPELEPLKQKVASCGLPSGRFVFTGAQPHERIPDLLSLADIGVAPFDLAAHSPLTTFGFYWSPLKVFEYMAMGLPVVTVDVAPLNEIVRPEHEGLLYKSGDIDALADALDRLASDPALRQRLGTSARNRIVERYSWRAHCEALEKILLSIANAPQT